ncbi:MAG: primosomal protein N' [Flavobacteriaceae bacterium]|jgi:primosomal protein N' (replication factor Y) (superfamily II helicase)|nr:primosomal protein N' [Formosa sp.]MDG1375332.1 primosomal protein N' [Flavobacteriaceae bacterium]MDG2498094.1 primosomal protein N' [Flavobacteriaceae bacterium]
MRVVDVFFIDVILPLSLERNFTYAVTKAEADFIKIGVRVAVPFRKNKVYTGIVYNLHHNAPIAYEAKSIHSILDEVPVINSFQFKLWEWMSSYYLCSLGEIMRAAMPNAFLLESETIISLNPSVEFEVNNLKDDEYLVFEALQQQSSLKVDEINAIIDRKNSFPVLKRLLDHKVIALEQELSEKYKPKLIHCVRLHANYQHENALQILVETLKNASKQREIVLSYFSLATTSKQIKVADLKIKSNATSTQVKALIDKEVFDEYHFQTDRIQFQNSEDNASTELNSYQQTALEEIDAQFESKNIVLLHGVTSSGKTEVYVKKIESVLSQGKQALYLVPEIALTSQLVQRLQKYFGNQIAVYHSRYSQNERVEVWNHVLNHTENARVVIGARSSVFLPFSNLGLVIVDEEHEQSYKQFDPSPRYHARDTAIVLAALFESKTLLGSATPSLESFFNATKERKYGYVALNKRFNNVLMPEIELVDLTDKYKRKRMTGHFSDRLIAEIKDTLEAECQVILFQNRRGYSPVVSCNTCGHTPECPNCDVSLTFHQYKNQLRCHYCSHAMAMQQFCGACGGVEIDSKGFGTEQIQQEIELIFPDAKVARMDLDTTRGKYSYDRIIASFENKEVDILVGTQMVTKGLDFRHVKLVGVLNADQLINFPDFRAHERSFQLLQQVAGRAGRTDIRGKVIVQTYNPYHTILQQVSINDYESMFFEQLEDRRIYKYPPYCRIIKLTLKHKDYNKVNEGADWLATSLRHVFKDNVLGPEFPIVSRIRNQYHKNILLKIPQKQSLVKTKSVLQKIKMSFSSTKDFRAVRLLINVDNY